MLAQSEAYIFDRTYCRFDPANFKQRAPKMETLHFVGKNTTLWHTLWVKLWEQNGKPLDDYGVPDFSEYNPQYNEIWQYIGTVDKGSDQQEHQFRHRAHPSDNERKYVSIIT